MPRAFRQNYGVVSPATAATTTISTFGRGDRWHEVDARIVASDGQVIRQRDPEEVRAELQRISGILEREKGAKVATRQPINTITAVDAVIAHQEEARIYGAHARGVATNSFTKYDVPHIVSQDPQVIPTLMKICRKISFVPLVSERQRREGARGKAPGEPSLVMLTAKYDEDISEEDDDGDENEEIFGYLTKADLRDVAAFSNLWVPNRKLFVDRLNRDDELDFAPDVADTISKYTHNGMAFYIHLLPKDVSPEDYIKVMTDRSVSFIANNAFFRKGKLAATDDRVVIDIDKRIIRFKGAAPRMHPAANELKLQGWTVARAADPEKAVRSKVKRDLKVGVVAEA